MEGKQLNWEKHKDETLINIIPIKLNEINNEGRLTGLSFRISEKGRMEGAKLKLKLKRENGRSKRMEGDIVMSNEE